MNADPLSVLLFPIVSIILPSDLWCGIVARNIFGNFLTFIWTSVFQTWKLKTRKQTRLFRPHDQTF